MKQVVKIAKIGKNAHTSTDPNDFIFHSEYNTFKIIDQGIKSVSHDASPNTQIFTQSHGLWFVPFISAFIKVDGETQVYAPNASGVLVFSAKSMILNGVKFNYVEADNTNIIFSITATASKDIDISYLVLEKI